MMVEAVRWVDRELQRHAKSTEESRARKLKRVFSVAAVTARAEANNNDEAAADWTPTGAGRNRRKFRCGTCKTNVSRRQLSAKG